MAYAKDGVFHANRFRSNNNCRLLSCFKNGFDYFNSPTVYWILAVLVIVTVMMAQGLGILLPTNLRVYFELQKEQPRHAQNPETHEKICQSGCDSVCTAVYNNIHNGRICNRFFAPIMKKLFSYTHIYHA